MKVKDNYLKEGYCIEKGCTKRISYNNWKYGEKRCVHHAAKKRIKEFNVLLGKKGKDSIAFKGGKPNCQDCGKEIWYGYKRCKSCSHKKELNHNWKDGISKLPYAFEFTEELKESIRKRDNYTCQNCSMTEKEHLIVNGTNMIIHHIDYNKKNNTDENLLSLCNQCNVRANFNRDYWQDYYTKIYDRKNY